jgi:hypothetical protein
MRSGTRIIGDQVAAANLTVQGGDGGSRTLVLP